MVQTLQQQVRVEGIIHGIERHSSTFVRDICRHKEYYHGIIDTWLVGFISFRPNLQYQLHPHGYIPLEIITLPTIIASEAQGGVNARVGKGRAMTPPNMSVTATSSHQKQDPHIFEQLNERGVLVSLHCREIRRLVRPVVRVVLRVLSMNIISQLTYQDDNNNNICIIKQNEIDV